MTPLHILMYKTAAGAAAAEHLDLLFDVVSLSQHGHDYGAPDYMPMLPGCHAGICLGSIINFAFIVLQFLQPSSPAKPITKVVKGQQEPQQTLNNVRGFVFGAYGQLKHLAAMGDPAASQITDHEMARVVNTAISSASFLNKCWLDVKSAGGSELFIGRCSGCLTISVFCMPRRQATCSVHSTPLRIATTYTAQCPGSFVAGGSQQCRYPVRTLCSLHIRAMICMTTVRFFA